MTTSLDHALHYIESHYPTNANGRLSASASTPHFLFLRTTLGCVWRFREDLPSNAVREIAKLAGREPAIELPVETSRPPERLEPITRALERSVSDVQVSHDILHRHGPSAKFELVPLSLVAGRDQGWVAVADVYALGPSPSEVAV